MLSANSTIFDRFLFSCDGIAKLELDSPRNSTQPAPVQLPVPLIRIEF